MVRSFPSSDIQTSKPSLTQSSLTACVFTSPPPLTGSRISATQKTHPYFTGKNLSSIHSILAMRNLLSFPPKKKNWGCYRVQTSECAKDGKHFSKQVT